MADREEQKKIGIYEHDAANPPRIMRGQTSRKGRFAGDFWLTVAK